MIILEKHIGRYLMILGIVAFCLTLCACGDEKPRSADESPGDKTAEISSETTGAAVSKTPRVVFLYDRPEAVPEDEPKINEQKINEPFPEDLPEACREAKMQLLEHGWMNISVTKGAIESFYDSFALYELYNAEDEWKNIYLVYGDALEPYINDGDLMRAVVVIEFNRDNGQWRETVLTYVYEGGSYYYSSRDMEYLYTNDDYLPLLMYAD